MKTKLIYCLFVSMFLGMFQNSAQNCTGFTTYSVGGWGGQCHGGNAGCYRDANFDAAFLDGIRIGSETNSITLTSSAAVKSFLPSGTTARALDAGTLVDPGNTYKNVLAGQLVALTLSIGFDAYDANFSTNTQSLASLEIASGTFAGMTVGEFLVIANATIGGTVTGYSFSELNVAASAINLNFDNGTVDNGYLTCDTILLEPLTLVLTHLCNSNPSGGQESITVSGGTAPYTFSLSNGATLVSSFQTVIFTGLTAGTYSVTVTDALGAMSTGTDSFTIALPNPIIPTVVTTNISCFGLNNGSVTVTTTGGTLPHTILWSNGSTNFSMNNLAPGTYTAVITGALGCTVNISATVTQPLLFSNTYVFANATCCTGNNGTILVTPAGGTAPYTILWSNGATTFSLDNLVAGTYTYVVTDANGCSTNGSVLIRAVPTLGSTFVATSATCNNNNGTITVTATGGTSPYTILWSNGSTAFALTNLTNGTYSYTITDANGCQTNQTVNLVPLAPTLVSTYVTTLATCAGNDATITVTVAGGALPYTILWSDGSTTFTIGELAAGTYTYTVTDANGCQIQGTVTITSLQTLVASANSSNVTCFGGTTGSATATATLGTAPYTILWSNGATTFTVNNLAAGTYTAVVTDANGCTANVSATVTQPATVLSSTNTYVNATCCTGNNGVANVTPIGGTAPYTILWSNGSTAFLLNDLVAGTYTYVVTDDNGCTTSGSVIIRAVPMLVSTLVTTPATCAGNDASVTVTATGGTMPYTILWSNGSTTFTVNNLAAGTYTYVVTDANGCQANGTVTITTIPVLVASATSTNVNCFAGNNGSVTATATGGTAPYTILWSNGSTTFTVNNLLAGTYTAVVTDARGCTANVSVTITQPATALASTNTTTNVSCFAGTNGSVTVTATGGTAPYTILWSNGGTTFTANNLTAGTYTAVITDARGCTSNVSVTITQPAT
ncbi:SprB repeat-containing protein, partial [Flavobacterium sp. AS60]|uniref:beta strand repeat-containing protein n=1 Tax=Flavobacterium anseongense TaxID=2910677 RepID=UPI001F22E944